MKTAEETNLEDHSLPTGQYGYSAVKLDDLGASEFTLVTIVNDVSPSVSDYKKEMEKVLKGIILACKHSPRADNLLIRFMQFSESLNEAHGFKTLQNCNPDDYDNCLKIGNMTALFDASFNSITATGDYAKKLTEQDFLVNAIIVIITDGLDNVSVVNESHVKKSLIDLTKEECLESVMTILIGVGIEDTYVSGKLQDFKNKAKLTQYVEAGDANAQTLAKVAGFISKSISSQSQALSSGGPSQPIAF